MPKKASPSRPKSLSRDGDDRPLPRDMLLGELRDGPEGVRRWNTRPPEERKAAGPFDGVDLSGARLAGADLGCLDFPGSCLEGADLSGAWLLEANLEGAYLAEANLEGAWCAAANFYRADLRGASLARANLRGCDFHGTACPGTSFEGATLAGADLCGADLSSANLRDALLLQARYNEKTAWPAGFRPSAAMEWAGGGSPPVEFDVFVRRVERYVDGGRLSRALEMLRGQRFRLYSQVEADSLAGVVRSQTDPNLVYSCRLEADGSFSCCSQDLALCLGLRGAPCKHLLVLVIGLVRGGEVEPATVEQWVEASRGRKVVFGANVMSEALLRYKAAEAGEIDWRPTETVPEDYYAL